MIQNNLWLKVIVPAILQVPNLVGHTMFIPRGFVLRTILVCVMIQLVSLEKV